MAGSASGIRAGLAFVELGTDNSQLQKGLDAAAGKLRQFGAIVVGIGASIGALGGAGTAFFTSAINRWVEGGTRLEELSKRTGASVESLSTLGAVAERNGSSVEELGQAFRRMSRLIEQAAGGNESAIATLAKLGQTAEQLKAMSPDDALRAVGAGLGALTDQFEKSSLAQQAWGRGGMALLPVLAQGADGLAKAEQHVRDLGLEMSGESAKAAHEFGNSLQDLWAVLGKTQAVIGAAVAPRLIEVVAWLTNAAVRVLDFAKANGDLIVAVAGGAVALVAIGGAVTGLGLGLVGLSIAVATASTLLGALGAVIGFLVSPVGATLAAVVLLDAGMHDLGDDTQFVVDWMTGKWGELKDTFLLAWGGILAAIRHGDLKTAAKVAMAGLNLAWMQGTQDAMNTWRNFSTDLQGVWLDIQSAADKASKITVHTGPRGGNEPLLEFGNKEVQTDIERQRNKARKANDKAINDSFKALEKAKADLAFEVANAKVGGFEFEAGGPRGKLKANMPPPQVWEAVAEVAQKAMSGTSRGTFNPFAAGALGSADKLSDLVTGQAKGNKHLKDIKDKLDHMDLDLDQ